MEDKKKYAPLFPKEYDYLNESYQHLQQQLAAIDYELDNAPKDKGPVLEFTPSGMRDGDHPSMRLKRGNYLEKSRSTRVSAYRKSISKQIGGIDEKQQKNILDRYDFETGRNGFKNYSKGDLTAVKDVNKQDKVSFDFMAASHFSKYQQPEKSIAGEKENIDVWSQRYIDLLSDFSSSSGTENRGMDKDEMDLDKD